MNEKLYKMFKAISKNQKKGDLIVDLELLKIPDDRTTCANM